MSPDVIVAEWYVQRFERTGKIDIEHFQQLSADAVPALDQLPEPWRSCALKGIATDLKGDERAWYATSWGQVRAREILAQRGIGARPVCADGNGYRAVNGDRAASGTG